MSAHDPPCPSLLRPPSKRATQCRTSNSGSSGCGGAAPWLPQLAAGAADAADHADSGSLPPLAAVGARLLVCSVAQVQVASSPRAALAHAAGTAALPAAVVPADGPRDPAVVWDIKVSVSPREELNASVSCPQEGSLPAPSSRGGASLAGVAADGARLDDEACAASALPAAGAAAGLPSWPASFAEGWPGGRSEGRQEAGEKPVGWARGRDHRCAAGTARACRRG